MGLVTVDKNQWIRFTSQEEESPQLSDKGQSDRNNPLWIVWKIIFLQLMLLSMDILIS